MFIKSEHDVTILFQNQIQIEDDLNASKDSAKAERCLMTKAQTTCNDRSSVSVVVINMHDDPISWQALVNKNARDYLTIKDPLNIAVNSFTRNEKNCVFQVSLLELEETSEWGSVERSCLDNVLSFFWLNL